MLTPVAWARFQPKQYFKLLLLSPLIALGLWCVILSSHSKTHPLRSKSQIDLVVTDLHFYEFNQQGSLTRQFVAQRLEHTPSEDHFTLIQPDLTFYTQEKENQPWQLIADHAITQKGFERVIFQKNVVLSQINDSKNPAALYTEELIYLPKQSQAYTKLPVLFKQPGHSLHSDGFQANLNTLHIQLHHAHAHIQPHHA